MVNSYMYGVLLGLGHLQVGAREPLQGSARSQHISGIDMLWDQSFQRFPQRGSVHVRFSAAPPIQPRNRVPCSTASRLRLNITAISCASANPTALLRSPTTTAVQPPTDDFGISPTLNSEPCAVTASSRPKLLFGSQLDLPRPNCLCCFEPLELRKGRGQGKAKYNIFGIVGNNF